MTYYIKGGSRFNETNPTVWVALNLAGFADSKYLDADWKQIDFESIIDNEDPFWLMGSTSGGAKELELGLYNDYRIKFETTGITYWDGDSWEDLLAEGGASTLNELTDVIITTPADNEVLAYNNTTSKWINQTAAEASLATAGHGHGQLHDIYTLEEHDNSYHNPNYKEDFSENQAFNKDWGTITGTVAQGDDSRFHTPVVAGDLSHNSLANIDADDIKHITADQLGDLHTIYTLQAHDLATSGVHQNTLPLTDLAVGSQGSMIRRGASDWEELGLGTENYALVSGATDISWAQYDYTWLANIPSTFPPSSHALNSHTNPTGNIAMNSKKFTGLTAGTVNGDSVRYEQLHAESHSLASHSTEAHSELTGYNDEANVKHLTDAQVDALHAIITAGDLSHNSLANLNAGDVYEHISAAQVSALHSATLAFKTITGITNDVVADSITDTLTLAASGGLTIVGNTSTDTITFTNTITQYTDALARTATLESVDYGSGWSGDDNHAPTQDALYDLFNGKIFYKAGIGGFPSSAIEGQLFYSTVDEALYRWDAAAEAWIQIGGSGVGNGASITLDEAFDNGKIINGATSEANAFQVGDGTNNLLIWESGNNSYIDAVGYLYISANLGGGSTQVLVLHAYGPDVNMFQISATTSNETWRLGKDVETLRPLETVWANAIITDDGAIGEYSAIDDLQLLRDVKTWDVREKALNKNFPNRTQKVFDKETLPWIKAHPDVNIMDKSDNDKRYQSTNGQKIGYLLSTMKKMLEKIDMLEIEIEELKN